MSNEVDRNSVVTLSDKTVQIEQAGAATEFDVLSQNEDGTILLPRRVGGFGPIKKYAYDLVTFVPRDPMEGDEDRWLIEDDITLGRINRYPNERIASRKGQEKLAYVKGKFRREADAIAKKGKVRKWNPFELHKWGALQDWVNGQK